jgi:hypothetical protein
MHEGGEGKGSTLGKRKHNEKAKASQHMEFNKEVRLDAILALIIDLNVLEQITNSKPPHSIGPFSFPLGMLSPNFESVHPLLFTPILPTHLILSFRRPLRWHCIALPLSWLSIVKEKVDF